MSEPSVPDSRQVGANRGNNPWMGATIALGSLLLLGVGALGGWLYANKTRPDIASNGTAGGVAGSPALQPRDAWALRLANDISVKAQRLAVLGNEAMAGDQDAFGRFREARTSIDAALKSLQDGNGTYPGFRGDSGISVQVKKVVDAWRPMASSADIIVRNEEQILAVAQNIEKFSKNVESLKARQDEVARAMSDGGSPSPQILLAMRQINLVDTIARDISSLHDGRSDSAEVAAKLSRESQLFTMVLKGFREGDDAMGIAKLDNQTEIAALAQVSRLSDEAQLSLDTILKNAKQFAEASEAERQISNSAKPLVADSQALYLAINAAPGGSEAAVADQRTESAGATPETMPATPPNSAQQINVPQQQSRSGPYGMTEQQVLDCEKHKGSFHAKARMADSLARFKGQETVVQELIESMKKEGASQECIAYLSDQEFPK
jgi:hypothetical protein